MGLISHLPVDILYQALILALPTWYPSKSVDEVSVSKFFATTAPYNISRVCRLWRDIVLSSPSLWSSLFLSFFRPSDETLKLLTRVIEQHLQRSENLPLALYVCLEDKYNHSLSRAIASLLSIHRRRWRKVHIWFETEHREFGEFAEDGD